MALLDPIRERFLTQTKVKESQVRLAHWRRLLGQSPKNGRYRGADDYQNVDDHCSLWNRDRKYWAYISQPYVLETDDLREIVKRCDENGLHAQVRADASWHFPGMTVAVIWTREYEWIIL